MDRDTFIKSLKEKFNWIFDLGYDLRQVETSVYFEKRSNDEVYSINFFWAEYDVIKIQGVFGLKRFDSVERIIQQKTGNLDYTIKEKWEGSIPKDPYSSSFVTRMAENSIFNASFIYCKIK